MIRYLVHDAIGRVVMALEAPTQEIVDLNVPPGGGAVVSEDVAPDAVYVKGGELVPIPEAPGDWALWDWDAHAWTDPRDAAWFATRLAEAKALALGQITAMRGRARLAYITDIPGQEGIYIAKLEEARAWLAEAEPDLSDYPLIASEVGVTAPTPYEVAQVFINLNALWKQAAGQIDGACFAAEMAVQTAADVAGVEAAVAALAILLSGAAS